MTLRTISYDTDYWQLVPKEGVERSDDLYGLFEWDGILAARPSDSLALRRDNDRLRKALARIAEGAPLTPPEWVESDNSGDIADYEAARAHYYYASIARAALADGEEA